MAADLVIFDAEKITDQATFEKPHAYSTGIEYVFVNGGMVVNNGKHTGVRSGKVVKGQGFTGN
jgi:N-acyl-D-amino-acid deacylase